MMCPGCSHDVPMVVTCCDGCGRIITTSDIDRWHREMVAPRKDIEDARFDYGLRQGDD